MRHAYAQARYRELTGFEPPVCGGPGKDGLTPEQRRLDFDARQIVARELGHNRQQITTAYCGKWEAPKSVGEFQICTNAGTGIGVAV